jgi:transcriptional regulator with XRE-family HTH domain
VSKDERLPLADQLQAAIATSGESLYAIAKRSGVSYAVLHRFTAGKRGISLETADQLARALGLTFGGDGKPAPVKRANQPPQSGRDLVAKLLQRVYDGALDQMVASVFSLREPTAEEIERLEALLAEAKPNKPSESSKRRGRKS